MTPRSEDLAAALATEAFPKELVARLAARGAEALDELAAVLAGPSARARSRALSVIERIGPAALPLFSPVQALLRAPSASLRLDASLALRRMGAGAREAVPDLMRLLRSGGLPRWAACDSLGEIGPDAVAALDLLREGLAWEDPEDRVHAAWAMFRIEPTAAGVLETVIDTLTSRESVARTWAAEVLKQIGARAEPAVGPLHRLERDPVETVRSAARDAIRSIAADIAARKTRHEPPTWSE